MYISESKGANKNHAPNMDILLWQPEQSRFFSEPVYCLNDNGGKKNLQFWV